MIGKENMHPVHDVIIIGGGISGLYLRYRLSQTALKNMLRWESEMINNRELYDLDIHLL